MESGTEKEKESDTESEEEFEDSQEELIERKEERKMATMGESLFKIEKLSHDNYMSWAFMMKIVLMEKELWTTISDAAPNPVTAEWTKKSASAFHLISLSCDKTQVIHIKKCTSGKEAWDILKSHHQQSTLAARIRVTKCLFKAELEKDGSMRAHLDKMMAWMDELSEMDSALEDGVAVSAILASLNSDYEGLVTAMEAWDDSKLKLQTVKAKLIEEWEKRKGEEKTKADEKSKVEAMMAEEKVKYEAMMIDSHRHSKEREASGYDRGYSAPFKRYRNSGSGPMCFGCGQSGHIKRFCPDLRNKLNEMSKKEEVNKVEDISPYKTLLIHRRIENFSDMSTWCIDSGATSHMSNCRKYFSDIDETQKADVFVANGERIRAEEIGTARFKIITDQGEKELKLEDVLWVPELKDNLFSVRKSVAKGNAIEFRQNGCYLNTGWRKIRIAQQEGNLFKMKETERCFVATEDKELEVERCIHEWHRRFSHRNLEEIRAMKRDGLPVKDYNHSDDCEACIKGKMARKTFPKKATPTKEVLDCIVSDVCGPMQVQSIGGNKYFVTFIDVFSKYSTVEFIKEKSEVPAKAIKFIEQLKTQFGRSPKVFRSDRGGEYLNEKLQSYLDSQGIRRQCTVGYASEQNGIAERKNRTLMEAARSMLAESGLPKCYWGEAVLAANYMFNRIPNKKTMKSPYEVMMKEKPRLTRFHEFGCNVYVMVPDEKRRKLDDKVKKMKFVGYSEVSKGYRVADEYNRVTVSREVRFMSESDAGRVGSKENRHQKKVANDDDDFTICLNEEEEQEEFNDAGSDDEDDGNTDVEEVAQEENGENFQPEVLIQEEQPRRSQRENRGKPPQKLTYKANEESKVLEPKTYEEAVSSKNSAEWKQAMKEELKAIDDNETWQLMELPKGRKAIGSKWVFKNKEDGNGNIVRRKARMVAQGFSQKFGVDYDEVFAPVARSTTLRVLLSVAGERGYKVQHFDIETAFLNGELEEEIYLKQPPGFQNGDKVYKLKKSLYGLKQAARVWNQTLDEALKANGCEQNDTDKCLYVKKRSGKVMYVLIHVDDILVAYDDKHMMDQTMENIGKRFKMKNLGEVKHYLGINIESSDGKFFISQPQYIDRIVEEAGLREAKTSKFPVDTGYYKQEGKLLGSNEEYRKIIGMLLYLATHTRPDIAASVSILSKKVEQPRDNDLNEVKRVVRYLKGTRDLKLKLNGACEGGELHAYSDSDWAEDKSDRKSNSGYFTTMNGGTISWCSRKQNVTALSSCEAEYVALTETCKEVVWLVEIARSFDAEINEPITIFTDSQSCMAMIKNEKFSGRTKHMETKYHYIREQVMIGRIKLEYVPTDVNIADLMTKPLGGVKTEALRKLAGLEDHQASSSKAFRHNEV